MSSQSSPPEALPNWRYRRRISASIRDDTFLYRDLLKRDRSLVIANIDDPGLASVAPSELAQPVAEFLLPPILDQWKSGPTGCSRLQPEFHMCSDFLGKGEA